MGHLKRWRPDDWQWRRDDIIPSHRTNWLESYECGADHMYDSMIAAGYTSTEQRQQSINEVIGMLKLKEENKDTNPKNPYVCHCKAAKQPHFRYLDSERLEDTKHHVWNECAEEFKNLIHIPTEEILAPVILGIFPCMESDDKSDKEWSETVARAVITFLSRKPEENGT